MTLDTSTLKNRFDTRRELAPLEPLLREAFFISDDEPAVLSAWAARAAESQEASEILCHAAGETCAGYPVEAVADAVALLGAAGARNALVAAQIPGRFARAELGNFPLAAHWQQARTRGRYAECIARKVKGAAADFAYCAAFLQDFGQPVLALLWPVQYEKARGQAFSRGWHLLEAETAELGVDHTLAGKRLAEAWGLPRYCIEVIWLHHHPASVVDGRGVGTQLLDIVAVADYFAGTEGNAVGAEDGVPDFIEARIQRLGIDVQELRDWIAQSEDEVPEKSRSRARVAVAVPARRGDGVARRYEALRELLIDSATWDDAGAALSAIAMALRSAFDAPAGLCFSNAEDAAYIEARIWRGENGPLLEERLPLAASGTSPKSAALAQLLARLGDGLQHPFAHQGLITLPMTANGVSRGQIVLDFSEASPPSEETVTELYRFAEVCGAAIARSTAQAEAREKAEHFATALWRQESDITRRLQAERLSGVQQLAAGAAHEINNPLAVISGRAQILLSRANGEEDAKALDTIIRQSRRVTQILTDLMQFARPSEVKFDLVLVDYILHQILASRREGLAAKGVRVVEHYDETTPRLRIDPHQMQRVFLNVILNAEEAMARSGPRSGGHVLTVKTSAVGGSVEVHIEDTGAGISAAILDQVFDPFFTTKDVGDGTGLGLAVCHGIVQGHGGRLRLESSVGQGCAAVITLPAAHAAEADNTPISVVENFDASPAKQTGTPRLLLAEGDEDLAAILSETLGQRGMEIRTVRDGLDALAVLTEGETDLVVLAHDLRGMSGGALFGEVRQRFPQIPAIVLLGAIDDANPEMLLRDGASACLRKPFEMARLITEIRQAVAMRNVA